MEAPEGRKPGGVGVNPHIRGSSPERPMRSVVGAAPRIVTRQVKRHTSTKAAMLFDPARRGGYEPNHGPQTRG